MRLLSLSEASIQKRTSLVKFARSPCTDPPGFLFFPKRFLSWGIKTLFAYVQAARSEQQRGRREGVGSSGVGSSGERRNPGAGLAAGREDVQRNF